MTETSGALILILHNAPRGSGGEHAESDAGVLAEVAHVRAALAALDVPGRVVPVRTLRDVGRRLRAAPEQCVVNLVESLEGAAGDACLVPAACSALGKAWTGGGTRCQFLALDKWQSKCALRAAGVSVPDGIVVAPGRLAACRLDVPRPVIVKPLSADASEGIEAASVFPAHAADAVRERVRRIHEQFRQPALVEDYVDGRELNVSVIADGGTLKVLPVAEIDFSAFPRGKPRIVDYRAKWVEDSFEYTHTPRRIPARLDGTTVRRARAAAVAAWLCLECRDYARIDMRLSRGGELFVMEVNPNPDVSPDAGFPAALQAAGLPFADFVAMLLGNAGVPVRRACGAAPAEPPGKAVSVRRTCAADRGVLLDIVEATGVFRPGEIDVAAEVLDDALAAGEGGHYQSYTALLDGKAAGWMCFGPTPCTLGTFDLYWLAVHPECRGRGLGAALIERAEIAIRARSGRLIVVETSSRPEYAPARGFYKRHGYTQTARMADFYERGDDKLVFVKAP